MYTRTHTLKRFLLGLSLLLMAGFVPVTSSAQDLDYSVLLDTDSTVSTGCEVSLLGNNVPGVERRLTATVSRLTYQVTQTTLQNCNTGTGLFDAPVVLGGGYPVALGQGINGADGVELEVATSLLGGSTGHITFLAEALNCEDTVAAAGAATPIPLLSWWGITSLAFVLTIIGIVVLRRRGFGLLTGLLLVSIMGIAIAAGFVADGDHSDWIGVLPVATDATGDSSCGIGDVDIVAGFSAAEGASQFFRLDILDIEPPVAVDDDYAVTGATRTFLGNNIVTQGNLLSVANPSLGLLANDNDPENDPLTVVAFDPTGTSGGTVSVNADGTFDYQAPAPGPATDTFTYTISDPAGLEDTATVTVSLSGQILTNGGNPITVSHVRAGAAGANTGTFENPFNALPATQVTNIVYVHADGVFNNQQYAAGAGQRVLGEGNGNNHMVPTDQLGSIVLLPGSGGSNRPVISNSAANSVSVATGNEVSNLNIQLPGSAGLAANGSAGNVDVNRTVFTGGRGIDITGSSGQFTFTDVSITDPVNAGLVVDGGSANVTVHTSSSLNNGAAGTSVLIRNGHNGTLTFDGPINATNGDGLQFDNADGTYDFNGATVLNGGDAGIDILGDSSGTFTFANTDITNPSGDAFNLTGAGANSPGVTYNGNITNNNGSVIDISNTAAGNNITFQGGTITDSGDGISLGNVGQDVNFNGATSLTGTSTGIDIPGGTGTFTFADVDITNTTAGGGININGGASQVNITPAGSVSQGNNQPAIRVLGGHTGTISFNGGISATNGDGIQFNNADGIYDFAGTTTLNGGDAGIDILGGSSGTFTFADTTTITNPTGSAVKVQNLDTGAVFNYNGSVVNNNNVIIDIDTTAPGSQVNFNSNGANTLTSTNNPNGGIFIFDGDGDITITTPTTITDPGFSSLFATDGDGIWSFTDMTVTRQIGLNGGVDVFGQMGTVIFTNLNISTDSAGSGNATTGFLAGGNNNVMVNGNSSVNADGGASVVLININTIDITFMSVTSTNNTNTQIGFAGDDGMDFLNVGGGTFNVTGTTVVDNADGTGISITGTDATLTFADINLSNIGQDGIISGVAFDSLGITNVNGGNISNTGWDGIRLGSTVGLGTSVGGFNLNNTAFSGIGGDTAQIANSTVSGSGNTAAPFSCSDGGGNTGTILFNAGADSCP